MDDRLCDLHTHSVYSDGSYTPQEIVEEAERIGLSAVALTDHNTSGGLPEFMEAGSASGILTIPGAELSTTYDGHEVHIVALFISPDHYDDITEFTRQLWISKNESNIALARSLTEAGYPVDYKAMREASVGGQINRSRFGDELARLGYMTKSEAFASVLRPRSRGGLFDPPVRPDTLDTIGFIRSIHAVPILAHPFLNFRDEAGLAEFLERAKEHGLLGMEVYYSTFSDAQQAKAAELVMRFGLAASGGSDFHGTAKPDIALGTGKGKLAVPWSVVEGLEEARKRV